MARRSASAVWELYVKASHRNKTEADLTEEERKKALDDLIGMYVGAQEAEKQNLGEGEPKRGWSSCA